MKERSDKCKSRKNQWHGSGSELGEHVATITVRGASVREPLQKAWLPIEKQTWGKRQLKGGFPRQEQQLPTQASAPHVSSVSSLTNLCLWISARHTILQPEAYRGHYPPVAAVTFTHLLFEMVNSHMGPKSSPRLFISCGWRSSLAEGRLMIHHGKSKIAWTFEGYAWLKVWETVSNKREGDRVWSILVFFIDILMF